MGKLVGASISLLIAASTLTLFVVGLIFSGVAILLCRQPVNATAVTEKRQSGYIFWTIGVSFLVNFVFQAFVGRMSAVIGWAYSLFKVEVATASLGCSAVGFLAAWRNFDLRLAAIVGPAMFLLGAAGHSYQMITPHDVAPSNAGAIFDTDIGLPLLGSCCCGCRRGRSCIEADPGILNATAVPASAPGRRWS